VFFIDIETKKERNEPHYECLSLILKQGCEALKVDAKEKKYMQSRKKIKSAK
jgi:hypothetical protein